MLRERVDLAPLRLELPPEERPSEDPLMLPGERPGELPTVPLPDESREEGPTGLERNDGRSKLDELIAAGLVTPAPRPVRDKLPPPVEARGTVSDLVRD